MERALSATIVNKPLLLERRADLHKKFIDLSKKHLIPVYDHKLEIEVRDVSGLSNPVYIVSVKDCNDVLNKIIIRFFESKAADFEMENQVFKIASEKRFAPAMIETDNKTYRVEQFYPGVPFECSELRDRDVLE